MTFSSNSILCRISGFATKGIFGGLGTFSCKWIVNEDMLFDIMFKF